jgi:hypothetical protein
MKDKQQGRRTDTLSQNETKLDIYQEIADMTNTSRATVARDIQYVEAVQENPDKYMGKNINAVLRAERVRKNTEDIENSEKQKEMKLKGLYKTIVIDPPWEHKEQ